jgi:ribosomal protein S18 acetylase RimI-like enzyme
MDIGSYQDHHHDGVVELWRQVFPDDPPWNEPVAALAAKLAVQPELVFVASEDGEVVGAVMAGYDGHRGWIYALAVHPAQRRKGIATALVGAVERQLAALGCVKLNLQVRAGNAAVVGFYEALGYATEDRISLGKRLGRFAE